MHHLHDKRSQENNECFYWVCKCLRSVECSKMPICSNLIRGIERHCHVILPSLPSISVLLEVVGTEDYKQKKNAFTRVRLCPSEATPIMCDERNDVHWNNRWSLVIYINRQTCCLNRLLFSRKFVHIGLFLLPWSYHAILSLCILYMYTVQRA